MICRLVLVAAILGSGVAYAQEQGKPSAPPALAVRTPGTPAVDERQKKLLADAQQLLVMAQSLKVSVDKTRKDELSMRVVRQADEIEKFAKLVKDRPKQ
jgi:type VI protein secretion system component VasF